MKLLECDILRRKTSGRRNRQFDARISTRFGPGFFHTATRLLMLTFSLGVFFAPCSILRVWELGQKEENKEAKTT